MPSVSISFRMNRKLKNHAPKDAVEYAVSMIKEYQCLGRGVRTVCPGLRTR